MRKKILVHPSIDKLILNVNPVYCSICCIRVTKGKLRSNASDQTVNKNVGLNHGTAILFISPNITTGLHHQKS